MAGYGAIGVDEIPSVHEGKCIQCHMPPTSYGHGGVQKGANHTFQIIQPEVAANVLPQGTNMMPYSACSTCHGRASDPMATYLQGTIEQRQSWTKAKIAAIWDELDMAAVKLGYADTDAAHTALVAIPEADWTNSQRLFLSSFTNVEFVDSEGSYGIHNFAYSVRIVNTAMNQAKAVTSRSPGSTTPRSRRRARRSRRTRRSGSGAPCRPAGTSQLPARQCSCFTRSMASALAQVEDHHAQGERLLFQGVQDDRKGSLVRQGQGARRWRSQQDRLQPLQEGRGAVRPLGLRAVNITTHTERRPPRGGRLSLFGEAGRSLPAVTVELFRAAHDHGPVGAAVLPNGHQERRAYLDDLPIRLPKPPNRCRTLHILRRTA